MAPRLHPISIIVFLIGVVLAATGITLALVFGLKECSCPVCPSASPPSNSPTDCSAKLFTIRTGVDNTVLPWSDDLLNSSSQAFLNATSMLNDQLTQTLQTGSSSQTYVQVSDSAPDNVNYIVSVTKFEKGQGSIVIAYASAAVTGDNGVIQNFQNVTDVVTQKLSNDQNVTVEPMVNYNSMQFCDVPNTNLSRSDPANGCPDYPVATCPSTLAPTSCLVCEICPSPSPCPPPVSCPSPSCPTDPSPSTSCPVCPSPSSCPTEPSPSTCPVCQNGTCPPPVTCPTVPTTVSSCPPCPSGSPVTCPACPTTCPTVPPAPTCPITSCPTCPSPGPTGTTPVDSTVTSSSQSCPPCQCSSTFWTGSSSGMTTSQGTGSVSTQRTTQSSGGGTSSGTTSSQPTVGSTVASFSSTNSQQSSTMTTTVPTTTAVPCPGGTFVYDGDLAIVFEVTYISDSMAFAAQNLMMNTFISTQLLNYGNFGSGSHQVGAYDFGSTRITKMIGAPYPKTNENPASSDNYLTGPRNVFGFNSTLITADTFVGSNQGFSEAHIIDGLQYVSLATGRGKFSAVVLVGISDDYVSEAINSSRQLQDAGYHVFTVVLNSTKDFSSLASDSTSAFTLPSPRSSSDASKIAIDIGNYLVSQSSQCVGAITTVATTKVATTVTTTGLSTTTTQYCSQEFLSQNIIYVFEATTNAFLTTMATSFLSHFLITEAQADLRGTTTWSPYTNFSLVQYPASNQTHDAIGCCDLGQSTQISYSFNLQTMEIYGNKLGLNSTSTGINEGLLFAQNEFGAGSGAIVLFATSTDGVATAQATATALLASNISIVTVAVDGQFDLTPLSSPGFQTHYLTTETDEQALCQEIIRDLKTLGTICLP